MADVIANGKFLSSGQKQVDLSLITAINTNFSGSDLTKANISAAASPGNLSMTVGNATGANLSSSDFSNAVLTSANLNNANLTSVNLSGANLSNATLNNATLTGIITSTGTIFCKTTMPDGTLRTDAGTSC